MAADQYNTALPEKDEASFQEWLATNNRAGDLEDYDLRGWWKKNGKTDDRGHMTDEFKKPNHPTFSKESIYHGVDGHEGGEWGGSEEKGWKFKASKTNVENMTPDELRAYFAKVEPTATLELPEEEETAASPGQVLYDHPRSGAHR